MLQILSSKNLVSQVCKQSILLFTLFGISLLFNMQQYQFYSIPTHASSFFNNDIDSIFNQTISVSSATSVFACIIIFSLLTLINYKFALFGSVLCGILGCFVRYYAQQEQKIVSYSAVFVTTGLMGIKLTTLHILRLFNVIDRGLIIIMMIYGTELGQPIIGMINWSYSISIQDKTDLLSTSPKISDMHLYSMFLNLNSIMFILVILFSGILLFLFFTQQQINLQIQYAIQQQQKNTERQMKSCFFLTNICIHLLYETKGIANLILWSIVLGLGFVVSDFNPQYIQIDQIKNTSLALASSYIYMNTFIKLYVIVTSIMVYYTHKFSKLAISDLRFGIVSFAFICHISLFSIIMYNPSIIHAPLYYYQLENLLQSQKVLIYMGLTVLVTTYCSFFVLELIISKIDLRMSTLEAGANILFIMEFVKFLASYYLLNTNYYTWIPTVIIFIWTCMFVTHFIQDIPKEEFNLKKKQINESQKLINKKEDIDVQAHNLLDGEQQLEQSSEQK